MPYQSGDIAAVFSSYYNRNRYDFKIRHGHLPTIPMWPPSAPNPPLPVRKAIVIATNYLPKLVDQASRWTMNEISLRPIGKEHQWVYIVSFLGFHPPGIIDGAVPNMNVVVLMNGQTIDPDISSQ